MDNLRLDLIKKALNKKGEVVVVVTGDSMKGLIPSGTKVKISKKDFKEIKVSEIVAFKRDGKLVVHQCVFKSEDYLVAWGINNNFLDGKVLPGDTLGTVDHPINTTLFQDLLLIEAKTINNHLGILGANPIWLKGPIYDLYLYGYFLQWRMPDLDVLIDRHKFGEVKTRLEKMGYIMDKKEPSKIKELPYAEISFLKNVGKLIITIDVHLIAVRCSFRRFFQALIEPDRMMRLNDELIKKPKKYGEFTILNDTSSLIHLCLNTVLHHAGRGVWEHARIAQIANKDFVEWGKVEKILARSELTPFVYFPLVWIRRLFFVRNFKLDDYEPVPFKKLMAKLLINRFSVLKIINLNNKPANTINASIEFFLRLILRGD